MNCPLDVLRERVSQVSVLVGFDDSIKWVARDFPSKGVA